ncbi:hypothetical protein CI238_13066, partial [Colletotrichum incanum]
LNARATVASLSFGVFPIAFIASWIRASVFFISYLTMVEAVVLLKLRSGDHQSVRLGGWRWPKRNKWQGVRVRGTSNC